MLELYRVSFAYFRVSALFLLFFALLVEGLAAVFPDTSNYASLGALLLLINLFHRHFLYGETMTFKAQKDAPKMRFGWFLVFFLAWFAAVLVVGVVTFFAAYTAFDEAAIVLGILAGAITAWLLAGFYGTLLPWSVERAPSYQLIHGLRTGPRTLLYLLIGPFATSVALLLVAVVLGTVFEQVLSQLSSAEFILHTLVRFLSFFPSILTAAVLCSSYKIALARADEG